MNILELFFLAVGLSMDAFAVAVCAGLTMKRFILLDALVIGLYFGVFQAGMPLIGNFAATLFAEHIISLDHWVAFVLLCFLGGRMILGSFRKEGCDDRECPAGTCGDRECPGGKRPERVEASLKPAQMLPLAVATSIDALAVGVSFAFLQVNIIPAVLFIGVTTFLLSIAGVKTGYVFGIKFKSKAEFAGGVILVLIGVKVLLEHLEILNF